MSLESYRNCRSSRSKTHYLPLRSCPVSGGVGGDRSMLGGRVRRERARPWRSATGRDGCRLLFAAAILATSSVLFGSPTAARAEPHGQPPPAGSPNPPIPHGGASDLASGQPESSPATP